MMSNYFLGIDIGTSSVKAVVVDEEGTVVASAQRQYDILKPQLKYAEQDVEALWESTKLAIKEALAQKDGIAERIRAIGLSGQMHGLVLLDQRLKPVRNAIIWADQRSKKEIQQIYKIIPQEEYAKFTLNALSTGFLISSLMWVKQHETENFKRTFKVVLPKDYIRYRLCGEIGTDKSDASGTVIFDVAQRDWAWELIDKLGLAHNMFPVSRESYEVAGAVTSECERELGLKKGTPVVFGGGDTIMQLVGNGIIGPGILSSNIGTASQVSCALDQPLYDDKYRTNTFCHAREGLWTIMGACLSGGGTLKWLKDSVLMMKDYDEMMELAQNVPPGSEGLLFLPYLSGQRTPHNDPDAKGIFLGLTLKHSREHLIRSVMEGVVFALKDSLEIFERLGIKFERVIASGGGARGRLFLQIQADVFGKEIYRSMHDEQACIGAAITAAVGVGFYPCFEEACKHMVHLHPEVTVPNKENHEIYQERFEAYRKMYLCNRDLF